jgi:hypothetical protein
MTPQFRSAGNVFDSSGTSMALLMVVVLTKPLENV